MLLSLINCDREIHSRNTGLTGYQKSLNLLTCNSMFFCHGEQLVRSIPKSSYQHHYPQKLDGSGRFTRISDAILAAPNSSNKRFYIHIKPGIYHEHVEIPKEKTFITLIGDNASTTIITDNRSNKTGFRTSESATLTVKGEGFLAKSLAFENSAGPKNGQAVAVRDLADHTAYYQCVFLSFQDTLYAQGVQFYKDCDIYGTVDFIFGRGHVVFQDCRIYARVNSEVTLTAQSKESLNMPSGYTFQNCTVTISPEVPASEKANVKVYLGRPWRSYSTVVFMQSFLDDIVVPAGWLEWPGTPVNLLFYAEYKNRGPGADTSQRVTWPGFRVLKYELEAARFTVGKSINGTDWLPETGIPFRLGLN